jgi:hypothetical protein
MTDFKTIASCDGFTLYDRQNVNGAWHHLKLVGSGRRRDHPKHNWWLAWNGERLALNRDAGLLAKHDPMIEAWVVDTPVHYDSSRVTCGAVSGPVPASRNVPFVGTCYVTRELWRPFTSHVTRCDAM